MGTVCRHRTDPARLAGPVLLLLALLSGCAHSRSAMHGGFDMPYPPKEPLRAGDIVHIPSGLRMSFDNAIDVISGATLVAVGETHDNMRAHEVELAILKELHRRFPGRIALGMEMFRAPQQAVLDNWVAGGIGELEFIKATKWYAGWGSDFRYYRDILRFARENRIDVIALNPSRELEKAVAHGGLDNLSEAMRSELPEIGATDPYQRDVLKGVYGGHMQSEGMFESFLRTQLLWEESMAQRVVEYLSGPRGAGKKMVTLSGGWHVRYGFGIPKKALRRMPMPYAIVLPEEVETPPDGSDRTMEVDIPDIPLHPGDFLFAVDFEDLEEKRAKMGVILKEGEEGVDVEKVLPGSPAEKAGMAAGDRIVSVDGVKAAEMADIHYALSKKNLGDRGAVVILRDGQERALELEFFKVPPPKGHP